MCVFGALVPQASKKTLGQTKHFGIPLTKALLRELCASCVLVGAGRAPMSAADTYDFRCELECADDCDATGAHSAAHGQSETRPESLGHVMYWFVGSRSASG